MRRARLILRRLFIAAALLSVLLLLATVGWWLRSYRAIDEIETEDGDGSTSYVLRDGVIQRFTTPYQAFGPNEAHWTTWSLQFGLSDDEATGYGEADRFSWWLGIGRAVLPREGDWGPQTVWVVPFAWLAALTALAPAAWAVWRVAARPRAKEVRARAPAPWACRERALRLCALTSLLLCVAAAVAWLGSLGWHEYTASWDSDVRLEVRSLPLGSSLEVSFDRPPRIPHDVGRPRLHWEHYWISPDGRGHLTPELEVFARFKSRPLRTPRQSIDPLGGPTDVGVTGRRVSIPYWSIVLLTAVLPAWRGLRWWRRRHLPATGRCEGCGYDLRASPERCPECGRPVSPNVPSRPLHALRDLN